MIDNKNKELKTSEEQEAQRTNLSNVESTSEQKLEADKKGSIDAAESKDDDQEGWVRLESGLGINE